MKQENPVYPVWSLEPYGKGLTKWQVAFPAIVADENLPKDTVRFVNQDGTEAGRIVGLKVED